MDYLKVREHPDLVRLKNSKAILNIDSSALNKYREERDKQMKLNRIIEENDELKSDLAEIKSLLKQLLGQKDR